MTMELPHSFSIAYPKEALRLSALHADPRTEPRVVRIAIIGAAVAFLSIFVVLPLIVVGGWAMSPMLDAWWPGWVDWFGGRQALRTLHFLGAVLLVAFFLVHVFEVIVTGLVNNLRSMITGYWRVPK